MTMPAGAAAAASNAARVPPTPLAAAPSVYAPLLSRWRSEKVATPATAATLPGPLSVAPPGLVASAIVTVSVKVVIVLPALSRATTCTGESGAPAVAVEGTATNTRRGPPPGATMNAALVAAGRPGEPAPRVRSEEDT